MAQKIVPVILAGGHGERLWPLSRKSYPKQFSQSMGEKSIFQKVVLGFIKTKIVNFELPLIITHSDYRFIVSEQLHELNIKAGAIIIEPEGKNTGPAILAASIYGMKEKSDVIFIVVPSDLIFNDKENFYNTISINILEAGNGQIVSFGVEPSYPDTNYDYMEFEKKSSTSFGYLKNFIKKPSTETAEGMLSGGNYLWNMGIFMFSASSVIKAFETYSQELMKSVKNSVFHAIDDLGFCRLDPIKWSYVENISFEMVVMFPKRNIAVAILHGGFLNPYDWNAVWEDQKMGKNMIAKSENVTEIGCKNVLLRSENDTQHLVGLGLDNIFAVAMPDAVLVVKKDCAKDVKKVIKFLNKNKLHQAENFPKDHRPWGSFESLIIQNRFQVKRIIVKPGAALSLQSHHHRCEHWIVVKGKAKVTIDSQIKLVNEGQSVYIPLGAIHRMENLEKIPLVLIEIQTGVYLGEDDIIRYEDVYSRQ